MHENSCKRYFFDAHVHQQTKLTSSSARASSSVSSSMKGALSGKGAAAFISSVAVAILCCLLLPMGSR